MLPRFLALFLPIILFLYWSIIGYAALALLYSQRNHLQNLLLAPIIGLSVHIVLIFIPNWFGIPVANYALMLGITLLLLALITLFYKRPLFPWKRYIPFASCILLSMVFMGLGLFKFGLNWLSFGNDDMINYALAALRFMHHGYNDTPALSNFLDGRDYSTYYWFMHVAGMERAGSELLLAWVAQITHLSPLQIFMPVIVSINLTLISSAGAVIYCSKKWRSIAIAVSFLVAMSGLQALGVFYQLIAQIFGISLLLATITLLFRHYRFRSYSTMLRYALLLSIVLSAVTICYPEVSPFLIISYIIFIAYSFYRAQGFDRNHWLFLLFTTIFTLIIINFYFVNYIVFLLQQVTGSGLTKAVTAIFPYLLVPTGFANMWNILPISQRIIEPWLSLGIVVADLLTIAIAIAACYQIKKYLLPTSIFCFVMMLMGSMWFMNNQGFVLFKLSMYIQPFIIITFVVGCFMLLHKKYLWKIPLWTIPVVLLAVAGGIAQAYYLERSYGSPGNFVEFPNATKLGVVRQFINEMRQIPNNAKVMLTTSNMVGEKLDATLSFQHPAYLMSRHVFAVMMRSFWVPIPLKKLVKPALWDQAESLASAVESNYETVLFNLHDQQTKPNYDEILVHKNNPMTDAKMYVFDPSYLSIFNRWKLTNQHAGLMFVPSEKAINYLTFIHSKYSQNYYLGDDEFITLYGYQADWFFPSQSFAAVGKYLMLQLINPTAKARIVLDYTATLNPNRATKLPQSYIIGKERQVFPTSGYGSARVTIPIEPQWIKGIPYVLININNDSTYYKIPRHGLMNLYGKKITLDYKRVSAYVRDISLISEQEYQHRDAPHFISKFPEDLANKNLEYSGIYEEGWVGNTFYVNLKQAKQHNLLVFKGLYPLMTDKSRTTQITVKVDGKKILYTTLTPNFFDFKILLPDKPGIKHVEVGFSDLFPLPGGDQRFVSAKLDSIGFEKLYV